ncbi:tubulin tyrosine ligase-like 15 [Arctopsyche grandis]|uniref:tubulin tyrosine ligase-like 15 n=1 Tax=Arctopsyche grandis TaxID=121162 RepID=UPI00406D9B3F
MTDSESKPPEKNVEKPSGEQSKLFLHTIIVSYAIVVSAIIGANVYQSQDKPAERTPAYWVYSQHSDVESKTGIMKHVHLTLNRLGLEHGTNDSDWDLLWSHDYPFRVLQPQMKKLKRHQLVNHFPGTGYITNKVDFATSGSKFIPKAFKIPEDSEEFKKYAKSKPEALFVVKDNQHRGVQLKNVSEINLETQGNFVQEYMKNPFLVDGHKFDIGVYTILTSVDPLRVYIYKGDVLFRYCPSKYYPFDPSDIDKYVIGDDYLPTWEVPSLASLYTAMGYGMRDSFDHYVRSQGKDPSVIWKQVDEFLAQVFLKHEPLIISALKNYRSGNNFFEMMRFDFVIDEDLNLYALEANMSPNLSSAHYPPNQLLYEQVLYSILSLVGVGKYTKTPTFADRNAGETQMRVSDKNIMVWADACTSECRGSCEDVCTTCRHCLTMGTRQNLARAVNEHLNRNDCRRVYPPPMVQDGGVDHESLEKLSPANRLMYMWFQGKCNVDITWCN